MFVEGLIAGFGIAVPVGAISVLILEMSLRFGFRIGVMAAAGAATADTLFATAAVVGGAALVLVLEPIQTPLKVGSAVVLIALGLIMLRRAFGASPVGDKSAEKCAALPMYGQFLGLTIINPMTVVYFTALVLGLGGSVAPTLSRGALFVAGAGLASLSWQVVLAAMGAFSGRFMSPKLTLGARLLGSFIVLGLAARILSNVLAA